LAVNQKVTGSIPVGSATMLYVKYIKDGFFHPNLFLLL
jgi:hypothetical protein